jgi:hypothetical protein
MQLGAELGDPAVDELAEIADQGGEFRADGGSELIRWARAVECGVHAGSHPDRVPGETTPSNARREW